MVEALSGSRAVLGAVVILLGRDATMVKTFSGSWDLTMIESFPGYFFFVLHEDTSSSQLVINTANPFVEGVLDESPAFRRKACCAGFHAPKGRETG